MKLHEKSLELNITHELLNLADTWHWFLTDIPLWRYWRPRYRLPFIKCQKSVAAGLHTILEGKNDPTGNAGGGYDVRIKAGKSGHLLFIQFKKGDLCTTSPDPTSKFNNPPHAHFRFEINGTKTNQHFTLRDLSLGVGGNKGNAVVYAFPLINDIQDLEDNCGKLLRKTKFVSVSDLDDEAARANVQFAINQTHNFRIGVDDMNRCEVNYFFFSFLGVDRTPELITDAIVIRFQKILYSFAKEIETAFEKFKLYPGYISSGLQYAFIQYMRYLLHYFEVSPERVQFLNSLTDDYYPEEYSQYKSLERDVQIINSIGKALEPFRKSIFNMHGDSFTMQNLQIPNYVPSLFIPLDDGINTTLASDNIDLSISELSYLLI